MKHLKLFIIFSLMFLLTCGCGKEASEEDDAYLALNDLLTTQRSTDDSTTAESTEDSDTKASDETDSESPDEQTNASSDEAEKEQTDEAGTQQPAKDTQTVTEEIQPYTSASSETTASEKESASTAVQPETVIVYRYIEVERTQVTHFVSDTYQTGVNTVVFSPHEIYYSNGTLHATMYIYNGHATPVSGIRNVYLSFDNGTTAIASADFDNLSGCSIAPGCYVLWDFTFPSDTVYLTNADLKSINTTYRSVYNY
jgi:SLAP domain-containing protein